MPQHAQRKKTNNFTYLCLSCYTQHIMLSRRGSETLFCSFRSIKVPLVSCWWENLCCVQICKHFHHAMCQYCWLVKLWGVISRWAFNPFDESGGTPQGIETSEAARNIPSLYPCMHLCKLISSSRHMSSPQDHKCLHEQDSEISLLH